MPVFDASKAPMLLHLERLLESMDPDLAREPTIHDGDIGRELERLAEQAVNRDPLVLNLIEGQMTALKGNRAEAERAIFSALRNSAADILGKEAYLAEIAKCLFVIRRPDVLSVFLQAAYAPHCTVQIEVGTVNVLPAVLKWEVRSRESMRISFSESTFASTNLHVQALWLVWIFPLFAKYVDQRSPEAGTVLVNQWDVGVVPGLSMCDNRKDHFLVPDNNYIPTRGYAHFRLQLDACFKAWGDRHGRAIWRGSTTGHAEAPDGHWSSLPRAKLCLLAQKHQGLGLLDAKITAVNQFANAAEVHSEMLDHGLIAESISPLDLVNFKYQVDIDGNSNAWSGFFYRLYTGSVVLKVESPYGYKQWFYDRLLPWINFVPVKSDLSDLMGKLAWLRDNDDKAREIGRRGRELAQSLEYESEMCRATQTVVAAMREYSATISTPALPKSCAAHSGQGRSNA